MMKGELGLVFVEAKTPGVPLKELQPLSTFPKQNDFMSTANRKRCPGLIA